MGLRAVYFREALSLAPEELQSDREVVRAALRSHPLAYAYVGDELKDDREIAMETVTKDTG